MIENLWEQSSLGAALEQLAEERGFTRGYVQGSSVKQEPNMLTPRVGDNGRFWRTVYSVVMDMYLLHKYRQPATRD